MASKKPNKEAVEKRMAEMKQAMVNVLKEMPIIEVAVKRIGISRDTFYRWKLEDKEFEKHSQEAMAQGIRLYQRHVRVSNNCLNKRKKNAKYSLLAKTQSS